MMIFFSVDLLEEEFKAKVVLADKKMLWIFGEKDEYFMKREDLERHTNRFKANNSEVVLVENGNHAITDPEIAKWMIGKIVDFLISLK